jgi:hypothetical protein
MSENKMVDKNDQEMNVTKRNGKKETVSFDKILKRCAFQIEASEI